ncbi:MAG TPA: sugar transferase [Anaerolineaceae bacterium]|nr:sugar transferase [Anaerolineaceae bacterium]
MQTPKKSVAWRLRTAEQRFLLVTGDLVAGGVAVMIALFLWSLRDWERFSPIFLQFRAQAWFYFLPLLWVVLLVETYDIHRAHRRDETLKGVGIAALVCLGVYLLIFFYYKDTELPRLAVIYFIIGASILTLAWRFMFIAIFTAPQFMRRILVIGAGKSGTSLLKVYNETSPSPFYLAGLIDDDPQKQGTMIENHRILGGSDQLLSIVQSESITDLVVAISGEMNGNLFQALIDAQEHGVEITTMQVIYEELLSRVPIYQLESDWIIRSFMDQARTNSFYEVIKRFLDALGGLIGTVCTFFIFPFISIAIILDSGFPVFFTQGRIGRRGQIYKIIKFRTMYQDAEKDGFVRVTTQNDERITRVGMFLRKSHLDELPQFINVLLGEMSLVGPRAERFELVEELQKYIPFYRARLLVKPGITGWAQINFGYAATIEDTAVKLEYDLFYIKHRNLLMDGVILLRTVGTVIGFRGT